MIQLQDGLMNCKQPTCNILQKAAMDQKIRNLGREDRDRASNIQMAEVPRGGGK